MNTKAFKAYQATNVTTAKPEKVLLMLYEGCIKYVRLSRSKMQEKKIAEKGKNISKALAIVSELINTLNHEIGGQLAADLENLYMFIMDKLIEANLQNKTEDLDVVEKLLLTLYEAWVDVVNNPRPDGVPSPKLQPELYATYANAISHKTKEINYTKPANTKTNTSAAAVSLSAEVKGQNTWAGGLENKKAG